MSQTTNYYTSGGLAAGIAAQRARAGVRPASRQALAQVPIVVNPLWQIWSIVGLGASCALAYHGFKRNRGSVGWALVWGIFGGIVWPITGVIAYSQGFAKPRLRSNRLRRRRGSRR